MTTLIIAFFFLFFGYLIGKTDYDDLKMENLRLQQENIKIAAEKDRALQAFKNLLKQLQTYMKRDIELMREDEEE